MGIIAFHNDTISERDVDLLLMLLCCESQAFADDFLLQKAWKGAKVVSIVHSQTDPAHGESDITIIAEKDGKKHGILIEDKINAIAMENQYTRYQERGVLGIQNGDYEEFTVYITAPQHYLDTNAEAKKYPNRLSYEQVLDFVKNSSVPCREYAISILNAALYKEKSGYTKVPVRSISEFWGELFLFAEQFSTKTGSVVQIDNAQGEKSARDTWIRFQTNLPGTYLYYKTRHGYIDLQFNGWAEEADTLRQLLKDCPDEDMAWVLTGKSVSLRIYGKQVEVTKPFAQARDTLQLVFADVARMVKLANHIHCKGLLGMTDSRKKVRKKDNYES